MMFRVFVFLVLAAVAVCVTPRNRYEAGLLRLIEKCKAGDVYSLPITLPALNPLRISSLSSSRRDFKLSLDDITIDGLQDLRVRRLSTDLSRYAMSIELFVPRLTIHADRYSLETTRNIFIASMNVVFTGNPFTCHISNLNVRADVQFGRSGYNTVISSLRMKYTGNVRAHFSGSPNFVNRRANARISQMMRDRTAIGNVENLIKERLNRFLRRKTPGQFIQIISNI